jgi:CBS domain-containing protein
MALPYTVIKIFTGEECTFRGKPLHAAIVDFVAGLGIAARCIVTKGVSGCYEDGSVATHGVEAMSYNMPLEITVMLPERESAKTLAALEGMISDGIMYAENRGVLVHKFRGRLLPAGLLVRDVMTPGPKTLPEGDSAASALKLLMSSDFHGLPIVDRDGRPSGMVTHGDLLRRAGAQLKTGLLAGFGAEQLKELETRLAAVPLREMASRPVVSVSADMPLSGAVDVMLKKGVKRLPVTNAQGRICGILSRLDVFKTILDKAPAHDVPHPGMSGGTVASIMRSDTPVLHPDAPVWEAVKLIDTTDIKRVAVVDAGGRLLGLISDSVLLTAFSEHRAGIWDFFFGRLPFTAIGRKHAGFLKALRAKTAGDIMRRDIVSVGDKDAPGKALALMVERGLKRIPVLDADGRFAGMLTRDALLRSA